MQLYTSFTKPLAVVYLGFHREDHPCLTSYPCPGCCAPFPVMLTRPQPHEAEAVTHEAEARTHEAKAKTHEAEARIFGLKAKAEFEAKFMRWQRYEKPKNV